MHWHFTNYILPLFVTIAIAVYVARYVARRRGSPGALPLMVLILAVAEWSVGYALELGGVELATKLFWAKMQYFGIVVVSPAWFVFAIDYTAPISWFTHYRRNLALLAIIPVLTVVLVWTNETHSLIWSRTGLDTTGPFLALDVEYGPWFWVHLTYSYLLLLLGSIWLATMLLRTSRLYRWQAGAVWLGMLAPWVANILYLAGLSPVPGLDLTPFAFIIAGLAYAWGLFRFHLLELVPIARQAVVDGLEDCVIVLDLQNRIVDMNPAAQRLIDSSATKMIGAPVAEILAEYAELVEQGCDTDLVQTEITWSYENTQQHYDLQVSPLTNSLNHSIGHLVVLHDVTDRKRTEQSLRQRNAYMAALYETTLGLIERLDQTTLLETIVTRAASLIGTSHGYLYVVESSETDEMVLKVGIGVFADYVGLKLSRGKGLSGRVWETGKTMSLDDYARWSNRILEVSDRVRAVVGIPLRVGSEVTGVIGVGYLEEGQTFTRDQIDLLRRFSQLASLALENARLYAAAQAELNERKRTEARLQQAKDELELKVIERTTALRQANKKLQRELVERRRAEERYRSLFEEAPVIYVITRDQAGTPIIADCNRLFLNTLGYSRAEVLERPLADFYTPKSGRELLSGGYKEALEGLFLTAREGQLLTRDGCIVETLLQAMPEMDAEGNVFGTRAMFVDITERKQVEKALLQSEARNQALLNAIPDMVFRLDQQGVFVDFKAPSKDDLLMPAEEFLGKNYCQILPPFLSEQLTDVITLARQTGAIQSFDYELNVNKRSQMFEARVVVGADQHCVIIIRNITERKQAEAQLLHQANILQNIFDAMIVTDLEFKIESWNKAAELMYGWQAEEVLGKGTWEVLRTELSPHQREKQSTHLFNRGYWRGEAVQRRKDGTAINVLASVSLIKDSTGKLMGAVAINRDVTERKLAEKALKKHQEHLEELVAERTAELSAANAELAQALRAKDEFVANMSHELRTPLSIITFLGGNLDTLYKRLDDAERLQMIRDIRRHTQVLNELIGNVLEVSRLEGGHVSSEQQPLNLAQLVREEVDKHISLAQQKSQTLHMIGVEQLAVSGDDGQLRQVIRNLLNNAIKYTPHNQQITCECKTLPPQSQRQEREAEWPGSGELSSGYWAAVRVVDTGYGLNPEDLPHLFERFFRVKNQGNTPGTGLGLSIVRQLIELHAGHIAVASTPGQGSIFAIYLPLLEGGE